MAFLSPSKITTMEHARKHRTWALWIMVIVYIFNFIDRQIVNILLDLDTPIIGGDVVDLNPTRDINGMTAVVAAKLVKELAAAMAATAVA